MITGPGSYVETSTTLVSAGKTTQQSKRFLLSIADNFLTQVVEEPTRRGVLLDLVLTSKEGLVDGVKVGGSLGCSDHEMVVFRSCVEEAGQ